MIALNGIDKSFKEGSLRTEALRDFQLKVADGEFITIFGPNGSGKTTLLNLVSGLDEPSNGEILINGKCPQGSSVGCVFQNYNESLFPWLTVLANVEIPLIVQSESKNKRLQYARQILAKVGLTHAEHKYIYQLSGGQKQLVAICRAIAMQPDLLIMDEPFSALDYSTTRKMELQLLDIWQEQKITTLFVSHNIEEAIFLADRVVVLTPRPGTIKKVFKVNLPRPRTSDMYTWTEFTKLRNDILRVFEYET